MQDYNLFDVTQDISSDYKCFTFPISSKKQKCPLQKYKNSHHTMMPTMNSLAKSRPMPAEAEVQQRFEDILRILNVPSDKARIMRGFDIVKKWEMVCQHEVTPDVVPARVYIDKLKAFGKTGDDNKTLKKQQKKLLDSDETSTSVLKHLEISLRTNTIDWVKDFLSEENDGLYVLVSFLMKAQNEAKFRIPLQCTQVPSTSRNSISQNGTICSDDKQSDDTIGSNFGSFKRKTLTSVSSTTLTKDKKRGVIEEDIHIGVNCLRAIMNNKFGFQKVFSSCDAIYCIVRSLCHSSPRTKSQCLDLLAALCFVNGGHPTIINSFERFRVEFGEDKRFQTLMFYFANEDSTCTDFFVSCMQFINIVVHSVENINYRVYLQYEFDLLGLEELLRRYNHPDEAADSLRAQVAAYIENEFNCQQLYEDSEKKQEAEARAEQIEQEYHKILEKLQEVEADYRVKMTRVNKQIQELINERDRLLNTNQQYDTEMNTLKMKLTEKDKERLTECKRLELRITELENIKKSLEDGMHKSRSTKSTPDTKSLRSDDSLTTGTVSNGPLKVSIPAPPPQAAPTPPPPPPLPMPSKIPQPSGPPPLICAGPPPPPPPSIPFGAGGINANDVGTIKRKHQTKNKLPLFNWTALKPNQVKETVFHQLDDDPLIEKIDWTTLEDSFKLGTPVNAMNTSTNSQISPDHCATSLHAKAAILDNKRLQNVGITRRKLAMPAEDVMAAVHRFDLTMLPPDKTDILQRIAPSAEEIKQFNQYDKDGRPPEGLAPEERFMLQLCKIERLEHKLQIMQFMANFDDSCELLRPQLTKLTAAASSMKEAIKFPRVLELVLAIGNYMNSSRRGGAFGFKLQSLESLHVLKSPTDRNITLLHVLAHYITNQFNDLLSFTDELKFVDAASSITLESLKMDISELERGYQLAIKERDFKGSDCPQTLVEFLNNCTPKMGQIRDEYKLSNESFATCVEFYGESVNNSDPASFFTILNNFARNFNQAVQDNKEREKQRLLEAKQREQAEAALKSRKDKQQEVNDELSSVLARKRPAIQTLNGRMEKRDRAELYDGALEDMITNLKESPYIPYEGTNNRRRPQKDNRSRTPIEIGRNRPKSDMAPSTAPKPVKLIEDH